MLTQEELDEVMSRVMSALSVGGECPDCGRRAVSGEQMARDLYAAWKFLESKGGRVVFEYPVTTPFEKREATEGR